MIKCVVCGDSPESRKDFLPVEPKGTADRKWACTDCLNNIGYNPETGITE